MYIIVDTIRGGYVWNSPIEGWCFSILQEMATKFDTKGEAQTCIDKHYGNCTGLKITKI